MGLEDRRTDKQTSIIKDNNNSPAVYLCGPHQGAMKTLGEIFNEQSGQDDKMS